MDRNKLITGQLVFRETQEEPDETDRKLMMVVGVIAVPKDLELKGEHKYTIGGSTAPQGIEGLFNLVDPDFKLQKPFKEVNLTLYPETAEDIHDETIGNSIGGILVSHGRWRV
jgi:hypothetical protein